MFTLTLTQEYAFCHNNQTISELTVTILEDPSECKFIYGMHKLINVFPSIIVVILGLKSNHNFNENDGTIDVCVEMLYGKLEKKIFLEIETFNETGNFFQFLHPCSSFKIGLMFVNSISWLGL